MVLPERDGLAPPERRGALTDALRALRAEAQGLPLVLGAIDALAADGESAWLLLACSMKVLLSRVSVPLQQGFGTALGAIAGLYGCGMLALVGVAAVPWVGMDLLAVISSIAFVAPDPGSLANHGDLVAGLGCLPAIFRR